METTGTGMKIRITDGWDYPVDEARITLICLGNGNYTRQIDFLFPKDGKEGAKYAQDVYKRQALEEAGALPSDAGKPVSGLPGSRADKAARESSGGLGFGLGALEKLLSGAVRKRAREDPGFFGCSLRFALV